jgi:hypothetical protein
MSKEEIALSVAIDNAEAASTLKELKEAMSALEDAQSKVTEGSKEWDRLNNSIAKTSEKLLDSKIEAANSAKTVREMNKAMKELVVEQERVTKGSAEWKKLSKAINDAEGRVGDLNDSFKTMAGSGVERAKSSFGLFKEGLSNFDFDKIKIGFSGIGSAMKAIPIFLIIEGIRYLIENWKELSEGNGLVAKSLQFLGSIFTAIVDTIYQFTDALGLTNKALEKQGEAIKSSAEKGAAALKNQTEIYDDQIKAARDSGEETVELEKLKQVAIIKTNNALLSQIKAYMDAGGVLSDEQKKIVTETIKSNKDAVNEIQSINTLHNKELNEKAKEAHKKKLEEEKAAMEQLKKLRIENLEDERKKILANFEEEIAGIKAKGELRNQIKLEVEKKYDQLLKDYDLKKKAEAEKIEQDRLAKEAKSREESDKLFLAESERQDKERLAELKRRQEEKENDNKEKEAQVAFAFDLEKRFQDSVQSLSDLYFAEKLKKTKKGSAEEEALARKQFVINKAFQIASSIAQGTQNAITAYGAGLKAASATGIGAAAAPFVGAGFAALSGVQTAVTVAKLSSLQFQSTSTSGIGSSEGGGVSPSVPQPVQPSPSLLNSVQPSTTFNGNYNNNLSNNQTVTGNITVKAEVVETDSRDKTNRINKLESESSY